MIYKRFDTKLVIRVDKGENLVESIRQVLLKEKVLAGSISGIGAIDHLDISAFNIKKKEYDKIIIDEYMEVTALSGNISQKDDSLYTHFHIICGKSDGTTVSGHLNEARIVLTGEIVVDIIDGVIDRQFDDQIGLNLIKF